MKRNFQKLIKKNSFMNINSTRNKNKNKNKRFQRNFLIRIYFFFWCCFNCLKLNDLNNSILSLFDYFIFDEDLRLNNYLLTIYWKISNYYIVSKVFLYSFHLNFSFLQNKIGKTKKRWKPSYPKIVFLFYLLNYFLMLPCI